MGSENKAAYVPQSDAAKQIIGDAKIKDPKMREALAQAADAVGPAVGQSIVKAIKLDERAVNGGGKAFATANVLRQGVEIYNGTVGEGPNKQDVKKVLLGVIGNANKVEELLKGLNTARDDSRPITEPLGDSFDRLKDGPEGRNMRGAAAAQYQNPALDNISAALQEALTNGLRTTSVSPPDVSASQPLGKGRRY